MIKQKPRLGSDLGKDITPFVVVTTPATYKHQLFIHNNLEQQEEMIAIVDTLYTASEDDQVIIHLNCDGGSIYSLDTLLMAMASCAAHIHVIATGSIASAATFILLAADSFEISPFATLLFHTVTFGVYGQSQDNLEYTQFIHAESERLMRTYYKHLFTNEEIDDIIVNKRQKYLTSEEFTSRWEAANKKMEQETITQAQEMQSELEEMFETPSDELLNKLTKAQLISYVKGEIDVSLDENGKLVLTPIEE
jgi:ATP-dependent protease ClpP protease subunit